MIEMILYCMPFNNMKEKLDNNQNMIDPITLQALSIILNILGIFLIKNVEVQRHKS